MDGPYMDGPYKEVYKAATTAVLLAIVGLVIFFVYRKKKKSWDFLRFRFQPSVDLLVVLASFLALVASLNAVRTVVAAGVWTDAMAGAWVPISMFIFGVLVPITYNNLVKKRPLSETGISKERWKKSLVINTLLGLLLLTGIIARLLKDPLTFAELSPLLAAAITIGLCFEIFFYGWVQIRCERAFGALPAIFISATFFALHHVMYGEPISLFYVQHFVGGIFLSVIFSITQNLLILWPFFGPAAGLDSDLRGGLRLPFEAIYGYIGVLALTLAFIAAVYFYSERRSRSGKFEMKTPQNRLTPFGK